MVLCLKSLLNYYSGHNSSVSCAIFNPFGNLIVSGSKDCSIKVNEKKKQFLKFKFLKFKFSEI